MGCAFSFCNGPGWVKIAFIQARPGPEIPAHAELQWWWWGGGGFRGCSDMIFFFFNYDLDPMIQVMMNKKQVYFFILRDHALTFIQYLQDEHEIHDHTHFPVTGKLINVAMK